MGGSGARSRRIDDPHHPGPAHRQSGPEPDDHRLHDHRSHRRPVAGARRPGGAAGPRLRVRRRRCRTRGAARCPPTASAATVTDRRAHGGRHSLLLQDSGTTKAALSCPGARGAGADLRFAVYPEDLDQGFVVSLLGSFADQAGTDRAGLPGAIRARRECLLVRRSRLGPVRRGRHGQSRRLESDHRAGADRSSGGLGLRRRSVEGPARSEAVRRTGGAGRGQPGRLRHRLSVHHRRFRPVHRRDLGR